MLAIPDSFQVETIQIGNRFRIIRRTGLPAKRRWLFKPAKFVTFVDSGKRPCPGQTIVVRNAIFPIKNTVAGTRQQLVAAIGAHLLVATALMQLARKHVTTRAIDSCR